MVDFIGDNPASGVMWVRIKSNSQFSSSESGLLSISEVRCSPIEKKVSVIDLPSIRKI